MNFIPANTNLADLHRREEAARIATASSDPGCPLKAIVNDIATGLAKERAAREAMAEAEEFFGPLRGINGDPAIPHVKGE